MKRLIILCLLLLTLSTNSLSASPTLKRIHFTPQELIDIEGHYSTVAGYVYIHVNGKQVTTNLNGKYIHLFKKSDGHFYPSYKFLRIFPISLGDMSFSLQTSKRGKQILMHKNDSKGEPKKAKTVAQKFHSKTIPTLWKSRLGKYEANLLKGNSKIKRIQLSINNGVLVAYINKIKSPYPLLALSPSKLSSPSSGSSNNKEQRIMLETRQNKIYLNFGKNRLILRKILQ